MFDALSNFTVFRYFLRNILSRIVAFQNNYLGLAPQGEYLN